MQVLIPISTRSHFFPEEDYFFPKPLIEVEGIPMIVLVVKQLIKTLNKANFIFVVEALESGSFPLDHMLKVATAGNLKIVKRAGNTSGALCACLLAIDKLDPELPLLISNSDQVIDANLQVLIDGFGEMDGDIGVLTFDSLHPRWSYVVKDQANVVAQVVEKKVVSTDAVAGIYWFAKAKYFIEAAKKAVINNALTNGQFFISASVNEGILAGLKAVYSSINNQCYHNFYEPSRIEAFRHSRLGSEIRSNINNEGNINIVIPAAGLGSRFSAAGWKKPKPFIDVNGVAMLGHVLNNVVTKGSKSILILRSEHMRENASIIDGLKKDGNKIVFVDQFTEGTACTVLLARKYFDDDKPLLIANSDQIVNFDVQDFVDDCLQRDLDGSILVFRDPSKNPKWSFAKTDEFGHVIEVAEKKPISDLATVGIYFFRNGSAFVGGAIDMIAQNDRVNGEFYTCPVYNWLIKSGCKIGVYEVPMSAMHGLGTPEDLNEYLDFNGNPKSADDPA